jgi:hypothetical protein
MKQEKGDKVLTSTKRLSLHYEQILNEHRQSVDVAEHKDHNPLQDKGLKALQTFASKLAVPSRPASSGEIVGSCNGTSATPSMASEMATSGEAGQFVNNRHHAVETKLPPNMTRLSSMGREPSVGSSPRTPPAESPEPEQSSEQSSDPEDSKDLGEAKRQLFLFGSPYLYSKLMQMLLLFNCFFLALYLSFFLRLVWTSGESTGFRVGALVLCPVPSLIVMCILSPLIIRNYSTLCAVAELNVDCLAAVLRDTNQYTKLHALDGLQECVDSLEMDQDDVLGVLGNLIVDGEPLKDLLTPLLSRTIGSSGPAAEASENENTLGQKSTTMVSAMELNKPRKMKRRRRRRFTYGALAGLGSSPTNRKVHAENALNLTVSTDWEETADPNGPAPAPASASARGIRGISGTRGSVRDHTLQHLLLNSPKVFKTFQKIASASATEELDVVDAAAPPGLIQNDESMLRMPTFHSSIVGRRYSYKSSARASSSGSMRRRGSPGHPSTGPRNGVVRAPGNGTDRLPQQGGFAADDSCRAQVTE